MRYELDLGSVSSPLCVWKLERVCSQTKLCQLRFIAIKYTLIDIVVFDYIHFAKYELDIFKSVHWNYVTWFPSNAMFHCLVNMRLQILAKVDMETNLYCLLMYDTVWFGGSVSTFRRNLRHQGGKAYHLSLVEFFSPPLFKNWIFTRFLHCTFHDV